MERSLTLLAWDGYLVSDPCCQAILASFSVSDTVSESDTVVCRIFFEILQYVIPGMFEVDLCSRFLTGLILDWSEK